MTDADRLGRELVLALDALPVPRRRVDHEQGQLAPRAGLQLNFDPGVLTAATLAASFLLLVIVPLVGGAFRDLSRAASLTDDFTGGMKTQFWYTIQSGVGGAVTPIDGAVQLTLESGQNASVGIASRCVARGDYDVRVDYALADWPPDSKAHLWLSTRYLYAPAVTQPSPLQLERVGTIRLVRRGDSVLVLHRWRAGESWNELGNIASVPTFDTSFSIYLSSASDDMTGRQLHASLDNFSLDATQVICY